MAGATPPAVSVVMAVWNGERHLQEALDGISAQTFGDFELIVVDNGSTDGSPQLLRDHGDDRLRVVTSPTNTGTGGGLALALAEATAPLVAIHDADDVSEPDRLARQVERFDCGAELAVLGSAVTVLDEAAGTRTPHHKPVEPPEVSALLLLTSPFAHGSVMMRRDALVAAGGYGRRGGLAEDYAVLARVAALGDAANLDEPLYVQRVHGESATGRRRDELRDDARRVRDAIWRTPRAHLRHGPIDLDAYLARPDGPARLHELAVQLERIARDAVRRRRPDVAWAIWRRVRHSEHARAYVRGVLRNRRTG